jgi:glycerol uptake facilitator-like aquaporin
MNPLISEFVGTLIFILVILQASLMASNTMVPILIGIALLMVIICFGKPSGGHFNPAVSATMYAKGGIDMTQLW